MIRRKLYEKITAIILSILLCICTSACSTNTNNSIEDEKSTLYVEENQNIDSGDADSTIILNTDTDEVSSEETKSSNVTQSPSTTNGNGSNTVSDKTKNGDKTSPPSTSSQPISTPSTVQSKSCKLCGKKISSGYVCNETVHNYTGYAKLSYNSSNDTVYIVCNSCGKSFKKDNYGKTTDWVNSHGLACYNEHNKTYISCGNSKCRKEWVEGTELYMDKYCNKECALATGYYCGTCMSELYSDGCHNCNKNNSYADTKPTATATPTPTPVPTVPDNVIVHYHGDGTDNGICPVCGLSYSPVIDISKPSGADDLTHIFEYHFNSNYSSCPDCGFVWCPECGSSDHTVHPEPTAEPTTEPTIEPTSIPENPADTTSSSDDSLEVSP